MTPPRLKIGFIGAGKVGVILATVLRAAGHKVVGMYASSEESRERMAVMVPGVPVMEIEEVIAESDLVFLAIPDEVLPGMISGISKLGLWKPGQLLVHTSGRFGVSVFAPAIALGAIGMAIHPAMNFTGTSLDIGKLVGCGFAITAPNNVLPIAQALVIEMGGAPVIIEENKRSLYHAALTHASNNLAMVVNQARNTLEKVGVDNVNAFLAPLLTSSLDNALTTGMSSLNGLIVAGDVQGVASHITTLKNDPMLASYKALGLATIDQLEHSYSNKIPQTTLNKMRALLSNPQKDF
ncbi:MAG: DUF2520 domain-containing protein [Micrococcaceae bacterium]